MEMLILKFLLQDNWVLEHFSLIGDLDNITLAAGVQSSILVEYKPIHEAGDEGNLTIHSNDPDTHLVWKSPSSVMAVVTLNIQ